MLRIGWRLLARGPGVASAGALALAIVAGCGGPDEVAAERSDVEESSVRADSLGARGRPAGVPDGFVVTPHGYFHPSCVHELADDEAVLDDGTVAVAGGRRRAVGRCQHPRYDRRGRVAGATEHTAPPPVANGWVASVWSVSAGPLKSISARWRVPAGPARAGSQTIYFFPGLEPAATGAFILQPVLAWNGFNDRRWTIASWNCCTDGNVWHSSAVPVKSGDAIDGSVTGTKCDAKGVCRSWSIRTAGPGRATTLSTTSHGAVLDWAFGGAFEAYGVDTCDQLPASGSIAFSSVAVRGTEGAYLAPSWTAVDNRVDPACLTSVVAETASSTASMTWTTM